LKNKTIRSELISEDNSPGIDIKTKNLNEQSFDNRGKDDYLSKTKLDKLKVDLLESMESIQHSPGRSSRKKFKTQRNGGDGPLLELLQTHQSNASALATSRASFGTDAMRGTATPCDIALQTKHLLNPRHFIGPGNLGSLLSSVQHNRASNTVLGTNKTSTLRFDQYRQRPSITSLITVNPVEAQFDSIDKMPAVNSKFKNSYKMQMKHTISRAQAVPRNAGNTVNTTQPNSPANTVTYSEEIPKFYPGQAGYRQYLRHVEKSENRQTKALVEWKLNPQGIIANAKVYNMPGVNDKNLS